MRRTTPASVYPAVAVQRSPSVQPMDPFDLVRHRTKARETKGGGDQGGGGGEARLLSDEENLIEEREMRLFGHVEPQLLTPANGIA
ncbi:hypothetical protein BHE74_00022765 [Ensete ventricosum]|nr:hypothetical protein GW17_00055299 [Ensete ventricosum]RWW69621.1 hypothetical protein BHE74_00022765 [Ensete ventricosum]